MDPTTWVLDHIVEYFPEGGFPREAAVAGLAHAIAALEGKTNGLVFGMVTSAIDRDRAKILALARDALAAWARPSP